MSGLALIGLAAASAGLGAALALAAASVIINRQRDRLDEMTEVATDISVTSRLILEKISSRNARLKSQLRTADELLRSVHQIGWHDAVARWRKTETVARVFEPGDA